MSSLNEEVEELRSKETMIGELRQCLEDVEEDLKLKQNEVQCFGGGGGGGGGSLC